MPYPNDHACRLENPGKFKRFARKNCDQKHGGKCIDVIYGFPAGEGGSQIQALRYPKSSWTADAARSHCKSRGGSFEAAGESEANDMDKSMMETRTFQVDVSLEERTENNENRIVGHAALYNVIADIGPFRERFLAGAFTESIKEHDVRAFFNHNPNFILGRKSAGTLQLREDDKGLIMEIDPPDTGYAKDLLVSIRRGDITQASIGFRAIDDSWDKVDGEEVRTVHRARLYDVSPVAMPAYEGTDVGIRSRELYLERVALEEAKKIEQARQDIKHRRMRLRVLQQS